MLTFMPAVQIHCTNCPAFEGLILNIDMAVDADSVSAIWHFTIYHDHAFDKISCLVLPASHIFNNVAASENEIHIGKNFFASRITFVSAMLFASMITASLESPTRLKTIHICRKG